MKKTGLMLLMAGAIAFGLYSCKGGDDDDTTTKPKPSFSFKGDAGYVSQDKTLPADTFIRVGLIASGSENLESVGVRISINGGQETIYPITSSGDTVITSLKVKNFDIDIPYQVGGVPGVEKLTFIVKMSNGETTQKTITLTVKKPPTAIQAILNITMGGQNNTTIGSFYGMTEGAMLQAEANSKQSSVNWIYYYGTTNASTLAAPNDGQVTQIFTNVSSWTTRNATKFRKTTMTATDFDNVTNSSQIDPQLTGTTLTMANQLAVGNVVLYITHDNQNYGLLKITNITGTGGGTITFDQKNVPN